MLNILDHLTQRALVLAEEAERIRELAADGGETVVRLLIRHRVVDQQILARELSRITRHPLAAEWPARRVLPEAVSLRFMRERHVLPAAREAGMLTVIVSDPTNEKTLAALRLASGMDLSLRIAADEQILAAIEQLDGSPEVPGRAIAVGSAAHEEEDAQRKLALEAPVIDLLNRLLGEAASARATDLHIEPARNHVTVRRRVDGLLAEAGRLPSALGRAAVLRLKMLTSLDIGETGLPQNGRARLNIAGRDHDIRAATLPTIHGESIAVRFLSADTKAPQLSEIGLSGPDLLRLRRQISHAQGLIVVAGPAGSGKTTTLAAILGHINDPARKIVTIEDPVEYQVEGATQVQVHPERGLTFARTLRSLLCSDADIMMIGEMREGETARIGVNAALTGHLVLTTLHGNSAAGAIGRLLDLGVQAYLIASTLRCVLAQRLVRKLCTRCRETYEPSRELMEQLPAGTVPSNLSAIRLWRARGCPECGGSGYSGRVAIFELLSVDDGVRRLIGPDVPAESIAKAARRSGMSSMMADGFAKCCDGLTTIEELGRVILEE